MLQTEVRSVATWRARVLSFATRITAHPAVRVGTAAWLTTRALYVFLTLAAGLAPNDYHLINNGMSLGDLLVRWGFWDTSKWLRIATHGYNTPDLPSFFPFMAILDWLGIHALPFLNPVIVAIFIGNVAMLFAFIALADLVGDAARPFLRLYTAYPWMIFLASGYSDTVAAALIFGALAATQRRWYPAAFLMAVLAGLTRPTAIILIIPLVLIAVGQHRTALRHLLLWGRRWKALGVTLLPILALAAAVPIGVGCYALYCGVVLHDPLAFIHAQLYFGRTRFAWLSGIPTAVGNWFWTPALGFWHWREAIDEFPLIVAAIATPLVWRRLGAVWGSYLAVMVAEILLLPLLQGPYPYVSAGRYLALAAPVPLLLVPWMECHPDIAHMVLFMGWALQGIMLLALFRGAWIV